MSEWFEISMTAMLAMFITAVGIYLATILFTRIFGKRSFSKMSSFDFAMTVAIGSLIATTVLSKTVTLSEGVFALLVLYALQLGLALIRRYKAVQKLVDNTPLLLMDGSDILYDNLRKARVSEGDLRSKLREANVLSLDQVRAVVFETTGDIAVLHTDDRSKEIEAWLLEDVDR